MKRIACIHTVYSVIQSFTQQLREGVPGDFLIHTLYDDFLATDPAMTGEFSETNHNRLRLDMQAQALTGADLIVVSCSTLSPSVRRLRGEFSVPVVAIDDAMVNEAVTLGSRIGLLAPANSTVGGGQQYGKTLLQRAGGRRPGGGQDHRSPGGVQRGGHQRPEGGRPGHP